MQAVYNDKNVRPIKKQPTFLKIFIRQENCVSPITPL